VTRDQLASNLRALDFVTSLDGMPGVAEPAADYWAHRQTLEWT
jgi:hypothetical protein